MEKCEYSQGFECDHSEVMKRNEVERKVKVIVLWLKI